MADEEQALMAGLARLVHRPGTRQFLDRVVFTLRAKLQADPAAKSTCAPLPLELYGKELPSDIRSSWVFVLREGHRHPAERHPNSIQRMFALDGAGAMEVWSADGWRHCPLEPGADAPGLSIAALQWHRPVLLEAPWGVVSFHTVAAKDLVEEIGDPAVGGVEASRHYLA